MHFVPLSCHWYLCSQKRKGRSTEEFTNWKVRKSQTRDFKRPLLAAEVSSVIYSDDQNWEKDVGVVDGTDVAAGKESAGRSQDGAKSVHKQFFRFGRNRPTFYYTISPLWKKSFCPSYTNLPPAFGFFFLSCPGAGRNIPSICNRALPGITAHPSRAPNGILQCIYWTGESSRALVWKNLSPTFFTCGDIKPRNGEIPLWLFRLSGVYFEGCNVVHCIPVLESKCFHPSGK